MPIFRGWLIVSSLFVVLMVSSGLGFYTLPILVRVMSEQGVFSVHDVSSASAIFFLASGIAGLKIARLLEKNDVRWVVTGGGILCGFCLWGLGQIQQAYELYAIYAIFGIGFAATSLLPAMTVITRWFVAKRAIAISIASTGLSVGGVLVAPQVAGWVETFGFREVSIWLGVAYMAGTVPLTWLFIVGKPESLGLSPDGEREASVRTPKNGSNIEYKNAVTSSFFVWFSITYIFVMAAQVGGMIHIYNLVAFRIDTEYARWIMGITALASITGRFAGGFLLHHVSIKPVTYVLILVQGIALVGLATVWEPFWMTGLAVAFGLSVGNILMIQPLILAETFGVKDYGRIFAVSQLLTTIGYAMGPEIMGAMFDYFGGYRNAFSLLGLFCFVGLVFFCIANMKGSSCRRSRLLG